MEKTLNNIEIKTIQDVNYIIGRIINMQACEFSKDDIIKAAKSKLRGSNVVNKNEIKSIVEHHLDILYRNNYVVCLGGEYKYNDEYSKS